VSVFERRRPQGERPTRGSFPTSRAFAQWTRERVWNPATTSPRFHHRHDATSDRCDPGPNNLRISNRSGQLRFQPAASDRRVTNVCLSRNSSASQIRVGGPLQGPGRRLTAQPSVQDRNNLHIPTGSGSEAVYSGRAQHTRTLIDPQTSSIACHLHRDWIERAPWPLCRSCFSDVHGSRLFRHR
jgi:hypothetical protein